jgi:hypothetical protein
MHSNFITPPDFIKSILIIDSTQEQAQELAEQIRGSEQPYNIYFYNTEMDDIVWFAKVAQVVDVILQNEQSTIPAPNAVYFGNSREIKNPKDYFTK